MKKISTRHIVIGIFAFAAVLRLVYLFQIKDTPFFTNPIVDEESFDLWAQNIVKGDIIGKKVFFQECFYPYFISVFYALFGRNFFIIKLFQFLLGAVNCVLIYFIGKRIFEKRVGILAGLIASIYPLFIFYEGLLLKPVFAIFFVSVVLLCVLRAERDALKYSKWFVSGVCTALSVLVMGSFYVYIPFVLLWMLVTFWKEHGAKTILMCAAFGAGFFFAVFPVTLRNYVVGKDFVLTSFGGGSTFYIGNNEKATGIYEPLMEGRETPFAEEEDATRIAVEKTGRDLKPSGVSDYWFRQGMKFILEKPGSFARLTVRKFNIFWNAIEVPDALDFYFFKRYSFILGIPVGFGMIAPLGLLGILLSFKKSSGDLWLLYFYTFSMMLSVIIFIIFSRYRLPITLFLILFSAYTVFWWVDRVREKAYVKILLSLLPLAVVWLFVNQKMAPFNPGLGEGNLGTIYMETKEYDKAIEAFKKALQTNPNVLNLHRNLGRAYAEKKMYEESLAEFRKALEIGETRKDRVTPKEMSNLHNDMGVLYKNMKVYDKAVEEFRKVLIDQPDMEEAHANLGTVYKKLNLTRLAIEEFRRAIEVNPKSAVAHNNLANLYRDNGMFKEALAHYDEALRIMPEHTGIIENRNLLLRKMNQKPQ